MIRNSTAARQVIASSHSAHSSLQNTITTTARPGQGSLFRARRRRAGTHVVFPNPSLTARGYATHNTLQQQHPASTTSVNPSSAARLSHTSYHTAAPLPLQSAAATARFSTTTSAQLSKKHAAKHVEKSNVVKAGSAAVEGDVIYRKEGGKIVPVAKDVTDQVEAPVSGLFSQFEDFKRPSSAPE
jgi:hypothetical protein